MDEILHTEMLIREIGRLLREKRLQSTIPIKFLVFGICSPRDLYRLENGERKTLDIIQIAPLFERLGYTINSIMKHILDQLNGDYSIIFTLFQYIIDYDFLNIEKYIEQPCVKIATMKNKKLLDYIQCLKFISCKNYKDIIIYLSNYSLSIDEAPTLFDVLLLNCYCSAYLNCNKVFSAEAKNKILQLENIAFQYLDFYPEVIIYIIIDIANYYQSINEIQKSKNLLDIANTKSCEIRLYDTIININLCRLKISVIHENCLYANRLIDNIEANFRTINIPNREKIIREEVYNLKQDFMDTHIIKTK